VGVPSGNFPLCVGGVGRCGGFGKNKSEKTLHTKKKGKRGQKFFWVPAPGTWAGKTGDLGAFHRNLDRFSSIKMKRLPVKNGGASQENGGGDRPRASWV